MAKSVNKVILLGHVGKDPEIKTVGSGTKVANLTLATSDRVKDQSGAWQERTEWHSLVAFARLAEVIERYVKKGSKLYIEGRLETRSWQDSHSGETKYQTQIKIDELVLTSSQSGETAQPASRPMAGVANNSRGAVSNSQSAQQSNSTRDISHDDWDDFR